MTRILVYSTLAVFGSAAVAGSLNSVIALPNEGQVNAMVRDSAGNLYLGGGAIAAEPATPVVISGDGQFVSAESDPGSIDSVWAVKAMVAPVSNGTSFQPANFTVTIGGVPLREPLVVWVN